MNGENTNLTENNNQKNQNKPQIDPFLVVSNFNEQFINQYKAFKLGQERFTEFAKKEREILTTEGINLLQSLQAKVMFFRARELAITYLNRLDEVEAKLEFTKKVLALAKNKKCKIVGSMLIIDEIITDENNNALSPVSIDIDEIDQLINGTDLNKLGSISTQKPNSVIISNSLNQSADDSANTETKSASNETQSNLETENTEFQQTNTENQVNSTEDLKMNDFMEEECKNIENDSDNIFKNSKNTTDLPTSVVTTKRRVDTSNIDGEGFDEIASRILNSLNKDNSTNHENAETNIANANSEDLEENKEAEVKLSKSETNEKAEETESEINQNKDSETIQEKSEDQSDEYPFEKSETSFGDVDAIDKSELEIVKVYKCNNDCIDLLEPENAELVYGLYSEELFNETYNKLLDVIYCYPLSIVTLPDVAIDELKSNETTVCINGINQTITTFEYLVRFCACVIMQNQKSTNFKQMVLKFYSWCKKVGI